MNKKPLVLAILDGWGVGPKDKSINAIEAAKTPFFDNLVENYCYTQLGATGEDVGLEKNQMSGSEAGHLNIGSGRIVKQDVRIILEDIDNGGFFHNPVFLSTLNKLKRHKSNIHLMGMMGDSDSPHSHPDIFLALLILLKRHNFENRVFVHLFTDGRDSFPKSALDHWKNWKGMMDHIGIGKLASVCGRFYAMDRVKNWDRLMKAYNALVVGQGEKYTTFEQIVASNYQRGNTDEYIEPAVIIENGKPVATIDDDDAIFFFNLRSDRARQFSKLFVGKNNWKDKNFPQIKTPVNLSFIAMTNFGPDLNLKTAYHSDTVISTLPVVLSDLKQLYIAETEKYAHITYFINGGYSEPVGGEERVLVESPKVRSYAEKPEMSAKGIADVVTKSIHFDLYDFIAINFANADMVGHTGDFGATVKGVEFIDQQLKKIYAEISKKDGIMLITSDHGNADIMIDKKIGQPFTFHTKNPVPLIIASENKSYGKMKLEEGILGNIAPTVLDLLEIKKPEEMVKDSLIRSTNY